MPSLVLSSRYTTDSQILRKTARSLGWETLRLDGRSLPDWFDPPDDQIAMFYTAPHAFDVASQLGRTLVGCPSDWTTTLPKHFLAREIRQTTLADALGMTGSRFVKHSVSKAFPAAVYTAESLKEATRDTLPTSLVHVGEPVNFDVEYRCFVLDRTISAMCPYLRFGNVIAAHSDSLGYPQDELEAAKSFAKAVLSCDNFDCPPAFVLDVGLIADRGWAVVECNECWASGIYSCDPERVLETLIRGCAATGSVKPAWNFRETYFKACSLP